jgi:starch phosphorylase
MRRNLIFKVKFYGRVIQDSSNHLKFNWVETQDVSALAYDIPIPGYGTSTVNNLRLWEAKASSSFNFQDFNVGNYVSAVAEKTDSETISKVLYPNDTIDKGKFLRLKQQYFFVSATLQDIIRKYKINHKTFDKFADKTAIQLNDTHPVIAIPDLMRILIDEEGLEWDEAWGITVNTFSYTNHTVVPEALEEWSESILGELLPRHLQIIYEINRRFLEYLREYYTTDSSIISKLSIIREHPSKKIRMSNLAIVGCHTVNGVAKLHTEILKDTLFYHFNKLFPHKFKNVTNGITPRRWLKAANPLLSGLITERIGDKWIRKLDELKKLEKFIDDKEFLENWRGSKWLNKKLFINHIETDYGIKINPDSMFDVQIKRFHEYKRQLLNVLHIITLYNRINDNPKADFVPRTIIFGGKAAPAYLAAKLIIKLINSIAEVVNNDKTVGDRLKIVFIKNYSVSLAEKIIPASELSEQISTAGFEASGTGNMKFALNGALTIGTMDGANIEIREEVGAENIFIFGLLANEVTKLKNTLYDPKEYYFKDPELKRVIDMIASDFFNKSEPGIFKSIVESLLNVDYYCLLADYRSYIQTQEKVSVLYEDLDKWTQKSILNVARMGKFSSDRSVQEYAKNIWKVKPVKLKLD